MQVEPPVHRPAPQVWPFVHALQVSPEAPQALVEVPGWQTSPWQQPSQFAGLHVEPPLHCPALQLWPLGHALQVSPPAPQVAADKPVSHRLPLQQPWQLDGLQVLPEHWLSLHVPLVHALHAWPPLPHALTTLPGRHTPPAQQPPHVWGPHEPAPPPPPAPPPLPPPEPPPVPLPPPTLLPRGTQKPRLQNVSVPHWEQTSPLVPQPLSTLPGRHSPVAESQQPVQLLVLHFGAEVEEQAAPRPSIERIKRTRITPA